MKIYEICFSPTGGTRKAADILAGELSAEIQNIDLTDSTADFNNISLTQNDISVIAVPSYGGRVPEPAAKRISAIHGNGSRANPTPFHAEVRKQFLHPAFSSH